MERIKMSKFLTAKEAVQGIPNDITIATVGMTLSSASETVLKAIEKRFLETGEPKNLTLLHAAGQSDRQRGILHFAHEGLVTKIIGSHWGLQPKWMEYIDQNKVVCYCLPQGQITHLYRAMACGLPGIYTKVGLGSFVDPRYEGGKMNAVTRALPDISEIITIKDEEYMFYNAIPIDYCIIRGTEADEDGNLTTTEEAMMLEVLPAVMAAKRYGGKVIAQVKRIAQRGSLNPKLVTVPGDFIDFIVVCDNPEEDHRQTSSWFFDPSYSGQLRSPITSDEEIPLCERKLIGRRAMLELNAGDIINLGTGIPNDVIGKIANEEKLGNQITITVESGIYNGVQAGGIDFGVAKNMSAMITHQDQMAFYNGVGVDAAFLGAGELDEEGNVNSTKMGNSCPGAGGFLDIVAGAKKVLFCSTFTAKGLKVSFENEKLNILNEGSVIKMVKKVKQVSLNGKLAMKKGQDVFFVTERAVFQVKKDGVHLIEVADGIKLQEDVLDLMEFTPIITDELKIMDKRLFMDGLINIAEIISKKKGQLV